MFPSTNSVSFQHYYQSNCGNVLFRGWHPLSYFLQGGQTLYIGNKVHTHSHRSAANHLARDIVSLLMYHFLSFFFKLKQHMYKTRQEPLMITCWKTEQRQKIINKPIFNFLELQKCENGQWCFKTFLIEIKFCIKKKLNMLHTLH